MKELFKSIVVKILTVEAKLLLKRHNPKIVAITGSVGKTSTKDAIFAAIKNNIYARKSDKSFNHEIGIPLTILGLPNAWNNPFLWLKNIVDGLFSALFAKSYPEVLVLEVGLGEEGDMDRLVSWLKPDIVVLTRLPDMPAHVELFSSPEAVVAEKMKLVSALKHDGILVYNNDDVMVQSKLPEVMQDTVGFGRYLETDFTARRDRVVYADDQPIGVEFELEHNDTSHKVLISQTIGTQHMYSCVAAIAVADQLSVPVASAVESLLKLSAPPGRMKIIPGVKASLLIDDSYNSSPIACEHALQALKELKYSNRKIVVLGDMLELGKFSSDEHKKIGTKVADVADVLFTVGIRAKNIASGALTAGMSEKNVFQYEDLARAGRELQAILNPGDAVLLKASQGIRMERIIEEVMAEPLKAESLLVRQSAEWKKIK